MIKRDWPQALLVGGTFAVFGAGGFFWGKSANSESMERLVESRREVQVAEIEYIVGGGCRAAVREALLTDDVHDFALDLNMTTFLLIHTCGDRPDSVEVAEEAIDDYRVVLEARDEVAQIEADMEYTRGEAALYTLGVGLGGPVALMGMAIAMGNERGHY